MVEQQTVLAPAGENVQPESDLPQEVLARYQLAQLLAREEAVRDELIERVGAEVTLGDPADRLDVAQAPGARLDVRLEIVGGVEIAVVALGLFLDLRLEKIGRRPKPVRRERAAHAGEQAFRAGEQPCLEQGRGDADVGEALALAVVDRADAVADLEPHVPQEREKFLYLGLPVGRVALRQQHHDVDVGTRVQFAAAVAADRDQRQIAAEFARVARPCRAQRDVDEVRAVAHQHGDVLVGGKAVAQQFRAVIEHLPKGRGRELAFLQRLRRDAQIRPVRAGGRFLAECAHEAAAAASRAPPAPSVRTSNAAVGHEHRVLPLRRRAM